MQYDGEESLAVVWHLLDGIKALMRQFSLVLIFQESAIRWYIDLAREAVKNRLHSISTANFSSWVDLLPLL